MPSAATAKLEKQASTEAVDPIKQVIIVVEHKIRNLEKRKLKLTRSGKKVKFDELRSPGRRKIESYREEEKNGKVLNSDQLNAVSKFNEVQQTLEFARELNKQFQGIAADAAKQQKKLARKEALERAQQEHAKVKEILLVQDVLQSMGQESVREDFLAGRNGAAQLTEEDLKYLDDLYVEVSPKHGGEEGTPSFQDQVNVSAEHLLAIVEGKPKELVGTTCAKLKEIVTTIVSCGYFDQSGDEPAEEATGDAVAPEADVPTNAVPEEEEPAAAIVEEPAVYPVPEQPAVCPDETQPTFPAGAQPTYAPPQTQPARVINEVIGSVGGTFNFLQESELDTPDISAILTGAAAQQHSTPPPATAVPVAVAPIPSQTFTNQNFAAVTTAPVQPQVVFQAPAEITQAHIPGFASATPNPPPPIPMPPSHQTQPAVPSQPSAQFTAAATVQQQQIISATFVSQAKQQQQQQQQQQPPAFVPAQQPKQDIAPAVAVPDQQPIPDTKAVTQANTAEWQQVEATASSGDWGSAENQAAGDWSTPETAVAADDWKGTDNAGSGDEWQQVSSQGDWSNQTSEDWSTAGQTDSFTTQGGRNYGGRGGRGGRGGGGRGSSNGYTGRGRGGSGYQNGRGGGSSGSGGYGYRNSEGGSNYYQNGYQQRDNFGSGNYAGGYKRGGRGGPGGPRGTGQRGGPGNRGGNNPRGGRGGNFPRGGGNKQ